MKVGSLFGRGALLLLSACLALACSKLAPANTQLLPATATTTSPAPLTSPGALTSPAPPTPVPTQNPEDKMPRINAQEAKRLIDAGKAVIIDVRGTDAYKISHIKDALDYPLPKIEGKDFSGLPKGKRIIAYCT
jgi:hypothetical protein